MQKSDKPKSFFSKLVNKHSKKDHTKKDVTHEEEHIHEQDSINEYINQPEKTISTVVPGTTQRLCLTMAHAPQRGMILAECNNKKNKLVTAGSWSPQGRMNVTSNFQT